tara:strand:- start:370 stop:573 length:204 start_codon:yes stop_codon:yes gene_type:complete
MKINSTIKLWEIISGVKNLKTEKVSQINNFEKKSIPKKETINNILAYSSSVRGVKLKSNIKLLVNLN